MSENIINVTQIVRNLTNMGNIYAIIEPHVHDTIIARLIPFSGTISERQTYY